MVLFATTRYDLGTSGNRRKDGGLAQGFRGYGAVGRRGRRVVARERRAAADHRGPDLRAVVARVLEIAPEIAAENGLAAPGDEIERHVVAERVQTVPVVAAA